MQIIKKLICWWKGHIFEYATGGGYLECKRCHKQIDSIGIWKRPCDTRAYSFFGNGKLRDLE